MKAKYLITCLAILTVTVMMDAAPVRRAGSEAHKHGISSYSNLKVTESTVEMTLLDETDTTIGVVRISKAADERSAEYLEADDHSVRLTWNLRLGLASIASNVDLQPLFVTFDFNKRRWDISQRAYVLLKSDDTGRLIAVMRDIDQLHLPMAASEATFVVAPNDWPDGGMEFGGGHDLAGGGVDGSDPNLGWGGSHKSAMRRTSGLGLLGG